MRCFFYPGLIFCISEKTTDFLPELVGNPDWRAYVEEQLKAHAQYTMFLKFLEKSGSVLAIGLSVEPKDTSKVSTAERLEEACFHLVDEVLAERLQAK